MDKGYSDKWISAYLITVVSLKDFRKIKPTFLLFHLFTIYIRENTIINEFFYLWNVQKQTINEFFFKIMYRAFKKTLTYISNKYKDKLTRQELVKRFINSYIKDFFF